MIVHATFYYKENDYHNVSHAVLGDLKILTTDPVFVPKHTMYWCNRTVAPIYSIVLIEFSVCPVKDIDNLNP